MSAPETLGVVLLLAAAVIGSLYRLIIKVSGDRLALLAGLNGISIAVGLVAVWFVPPLDRAAWPHLVVSSIAYTLAMWLLSRGYRHGAFSDVTPVQDAVRVLTAAALAVLVLGEVATWLHVAALALVALALVVQHPLASAMSTQRLRVVGLALAAGLASGVQYAADVGGVREVTAPASYIVWNLFIGAPIVVTGFVTRPTRVLADLRGELPRILGGAVLDIVGYALVLAVARWLALVEILPVLNLRIVVSALIGVLLLREGLGARRLAAGLLLVAAAVTVQFA